MKELFDSIFKPLLKWLNMIYTNITQLQVPFSYSFDIGKYLGVFAHLGQYWITFIATAGFLAFCYVVVLIVVSSQGLIIKFKDMVKWW